MSALVAAAFSAESRQTLATARAQKSAEGGQQAIACLRSEAAEAAREAMEQGGNAIDAAAAAIMALFVIEPSMTGFGGYGGCMAIYHAKSGKVRTIDCTSRAPRKFDRDKLNAKSADHGYLAIGVPGNVAGVDLAIREYGTQSFRKLATHAIALAENGIVVKPRLALEFAALLREIEPLSRRAYFPQGVPAQGTVWKQPDLARLIRRLGDEGPGSFYTGEVAATICKQVQANGGTLAEEDFHEFKATKNEPLHINYRGFDLYTPPLPAGGLTSLSILKTLEQFELSEYTPWGAPYFELFAGATNLAWGERQRYFGDPDFAKVPMEELLSEKNAQAHAAELRKGMPAATGRPSDASHTVNVVVMDKDQNIVSWTATHGNDFGSHVAIDGLGLMLGHGMSRFDLGAAGPNSPAPGKRPQHNMAPLVVVKDGKPYAGLGLPGGTKIVTVTSQLAVSLIDFKASPQKVVSAPRIHIEGKDPIRASFDLPVAVVEQLRKDGHKVEYVDNVGGDANAIAINSKTGQLDAAASKNSNGVLVF